MEPAMDDKTHGHGDDTGGGENVTLHRQGKGPRNLADWVRTDADHDVLIGTCVK